VNCSEIRGVTSAVFIRPLFAFCRRSPQLILRLYYVFIAATAVGDTSTNGVNLAERLPTIRELLGSVNASALHRIDV
jgi:hypothetical protein